MLAWFLVASDPWFGPDKLRHMTASYILTNAVAEAGLSPTQASGLVLGFGLSKELWDMGGRGTASWRDLAWDLAGVVLGYLVVEHMKR